MEHFTCEVEVAMDGQVTLRPRGELDLTTAPILSDCLDRLVTGPASMIILNLSEVGFCDSSGLSALVHARERAVRNGRTLRIQSPTQRMSTLLQLTNLTELFEGEPVRGKGAAAVERDLVREVTASKQELLELRSKSSHEDLTDEERVRIGQLEAHMASDWDLIRRERAGREHS